MRASPCLLVALSFGLLAACGDDDGPRPDAGADATMPDAGSCRATEADFPAPVAGQCAAREVDPDATLPAGDDGAGGVILPGARRVLPVGGIVELPGFPLRVVPVPGTRLALVTDGGVADETFSVVDLDALAVLDQEVFPERVTDALYLGLVTSADGSRVWVSGGGSNRIVAFDLDTATGALTRATARDVSIGTPGEGGYVGGMRLLSDDRTIVATLQLDDAVLLVDTTTRTTTRIALESSTYPFDLVISPDEATAWVSLWGAASVVPVDLAARTVGPAVAVGKNPEGLAFSPDGTRIVVAGSDSDSLSVVDVATRTVTATVWIAGETEPRGAMPAAVSFDAAGRLYAANAGDNAIDVFEPAGASYRRVGRIPTMWHPTDVHVTADGTVLVLNGKHVGTGANVTPGATDITDLVGGSLAVLPPGTFDDAQLATWEMEIGAGNTRAARFQEVECPPGASYDFPIPRPGEGPSPHIRHVIVVVRENKTHDAYFGNLTNADGTPHGNGDPALTLLPPGEMDQVLPNTRGLALAFAMGDNYYSLAEQSLQGHIWTTHGRTTDFVERSWLTTWGRGYFGIPPQGVIEPIGYPEEGSVFDWLVANDVTVANYGEIVASRSAPPDPGFPGLVYNMGVADAVKAEYLRGRWQDRCALRSFSYVGMPNDHTYGRQPGMPSPRSMIADNDEGVGRLVDALSHSTYWPESVVFIIEDDPQDGGDHIDNHRSPLLVVSPWVRRGYVSRVHYNESSIFRTIQLILGVDEPLNAFWEHASPMLDLFTSTPDFTPYVYAPRQWPEDLNPADGSSMAAISMAWDFSQPDEQPGLSRLLWRHLRGTEPPWAIGRDELLEALAEQAEEHEAGED